MRTIKEMEPENDTPKSGASYPYFEMDPDNIIILKEPKEYYEYLKGMFSNAKNRIIISSLYLGTGQLEQDLVNSIEKNMSNNKDLNVKVMFDYSRGIRNKNNSKAMLQKCLSTFNDRFQLFLYHTPSLRGILKSVLPERANEIIGVMHIKVYIADNDLVITGANLSNDYFVDRQDRYMVLKDVKPLCDFYSSLFDKITEFSFQVKSNGDVTFNNLDQSLHPYLGEYSQFCTTFSKSIYSLFNNYTKLDFNSIDFCQDELIKDSKKAFIVPLVQSGNIGVRIDEQFTNEVVLKSSSTGLVHLATGYFNLTSNMINRIFKSNAEIKILTTSPLGNGFYGSKGPSGYIPDIYTCIEKDFYQSTIKSMQENRVKLFEYYKKDWTFHAKGLWLAPDRKVSTLPTLTIIGSSNFGHRSVHKDLEFQLAIFSQNEHFKKRLLSEQTHVYESSKMVTDLTHFNKATVWVRLLRRLLKSYL